MCCPSSVFLNYNLFPVFLLGFDLFPVFFSSFICWQCSGWWQMRGRPWYLSRAAGPHKSATISTQKQLLLLFLLIFKSDGWPKTLVRVETGATITISTQEWTQDCSDWYYSSWYLSQGSSFSVDIGYCCYFCWRLNWCRGRFSQDWFKATNSVCCVTTSAESTRQGWFLATTKLMQITPWPMTNNSTHISLGT